MAKAIQPEDLAAYSMLSEPSLAPDGTFAAISVHRARLDKDEYEGNIWIVPFDGKAPRRLTTSGKDGAPKVSPDGERILFTSKRGLRKEDKGNALYVIPASGRTAKLVLRRKQGIEGAAWSPDGKRVLFLSNVGEDDEDVRTIRRINFWFNDKGFIYNLRKHVFILNLATKAVKQVTKGEFDVTKAAWSRSTRWRSRVSPGPRTTGASSSAGTTCRGDSPRTNTYGCSARKAARRSVSIRWIGTPQTASIATSAWAA